MPAFLCAFSAALAAPPALGAEQDDFNAVYRDWREDRRITPCRWSQAQLDNADRVASGSPDFQYSTDFQDDVRREIARWRSGGCAGVSPQVVRSKSPLRGVRIVAVSGRGDASREVVRIRNTTRKTVALTGATLRSRTGKRAAFPARFRLASGKTARVAVGCGRGRRAGFRGLNVFLCRRAALFADRGDAARLADARGVLVSQRGFGRYATLIAY